jgi:hypothetical protein
MGAVYGDSWGKQPTNVGASSRLNMAIFDGKLLDDPRVMELWEDYFMIYIYTHIYSIAICWRNLGRRKKENCLEGIEDVTNLFWSIPAAWFPVDVPCSKVGFHCPIGRSRAMIAAKDTPDLSQYLLNLLEASLCWLVCGASAWFKRANSTGIGW